MTKKYYFNILWADILGTEFYPLNFYSTYEYSSPEIITSEDLFNAVHKGNLTFLENHINKYNVNLLNDKGYSLLEYAMVYSQFEIADFLINSGTNLDLITTQGKSLKTIIEGYKYPLSIKKNANFLQESIIDFKVTDDNHEVDLIRTDDIMESCCIIL